MLLLQGARQVFDGRNVSIRCQDDYWFIKIVPEWLKTVEMCTGAIEKAPWVLHYVPDHLKTQEMCNEAENDHLKTEKMCKKAVKKDSWSLKYVPDWFVMHQKILQVMKPIIDRRCMFPHNDDDLIKW